MIFGRNDQAGMTKHLMTKYLVAKQLWIYGLIWLATGAIESVWAVPAQPPLPDLLQDSQADPAQILPQTSQAQTSQAQTSQAPAQPAQPVSITDIQLSPTAEGLNLRLQTAAAASLEPTQAQYGQQTTIDIPNAQIQQPWRQDNPVEGIAAVEVTQVESAQSASLVRVTVTGTTVAPNVTVASDPQGLLLSFAPVTDQAEALPPVTSPAVPPPLNDAIRIIVTGEPEGYRVSESSVGTRTDADIRDVPQSIQVIPEQVIEDQGIRTVGETVQNTAGISTGRVSSDSLATQLVIRGFPTDNILRNGLRDGTQRFTTGITNVEQVEILRGPASVLYGLGDLGGTVNVVTKQPLDQPFAELEYSLGQFDSHRPVLDFSIPFGQNNAQGFRFNAAYDSSGSFRDFERSQLWFVSPSLSLIDTDTTSLTADLEYLKFSSDGGAPELPALGTVLENPNGNVDLSANLGEPSLAESEVFARRAGYLFEHRFSPDWRVRNEFLAAFVDFKENTFTLPIRLDPDGRLLTRIIAENPSQQENYTLNTNILGEFATGIVDHQLLLGIELFKDRLEDQITYRNVDNINIFDPVYRPESLGSTVIPQTDTVTETNSIGLYAQHQMSLFDRLILVLGGRLDFVDQNYEDILNAEQGFERRDQAFSPRVGLVYKPAEPVSIYASYSESFKPVIGRETSRDANNALVIGEPFQPERGRQFEVGVKTDLFDEQFSATLTLYHLTRTNVSVTGLSDAALQEQVGEQRSQGVEFNLTGEILPGWNVIASYAYTDAEIAEDNRFEVGDRLPNVAENAASLWTTYELQEGMLAGLGFGVGLFYQGERLGDLENSFTLPSYWRTDASIFYRRDRFRAALNVRNLFDIEYYEGARNNVRVIPGAPFTLSGTVSWEF
jgi:iron complex outermembrane recepter protein